jgi:hypothetical protein
MKKKIIKLTESDLLKIINNLINESDDSYMTLLNDLKTDNEELETIINQSEKKLRHNNRIIKFYESIINPNVSISEVRVNNNYVIKGSYQIIDLHNVKHRFSVFVGKKDDFKNGKNDDIVKKIAKEKILKLIEKKFYGYTPPL